MNPRLKKFLLSARNIIGWGALAFIIVQVILAGYTMSWTGFGEYTLPNGDFVLGKKLWDWMELLIIPLVLAIGAFALNRSERAIERQAAEDRVNLEREIATDRQQEAALQSYLDRMADLLLKEKLRTSENEEVRDVARTRTLTVLRALDANRKGLVIQFLNEAKLIKGPEPIIVLKDVDLRGANLHGAYLRGAYLEGANLEDAEMHHAYLSEALLQNANLMGANLQGANLSNAIMHHSNLQGANLKSANLFGTVFDGANLEGANLQGTIQMEKAFLHETNLKGATMPDGTKRG